ncbi:MAG: prepilin-type N-terminal cleavage/methylation domain-containing protein [Acidimicrobiales bacterium]|jgi:type IV pilus assembly protein PilA
MMSSVIKRLHDRRDAAVELGEDAGFTLIELMVVLLILAILLAIAIPTFLGVTGGANDRAAQSNLNTAITSLKTQATQSGQSYGAATAYITAATMKGNEPSLNWFQTATAAQTGGAAVSAPALNSSPSNTVSFYVSSDGNGVVVTGFSKNNNTCWIIADNLQAVAQTSAPYSATAAGSSTAVPTTAGTYYGKGTSNASGVGVIGCDAGLAPALVTNTTWSSNFTAAAVVS